MPFNHTLKAALLECDFLSSVSEVTKLRDPGPVSWRKEISHDPQNFLLQFPPRFAGISCSWPVFLPGEAGPARKLFGGFPMLSPRVTFILPLQMPVLLARLSAPIQKPHFFPYIFGFFSMQSLQPVLVVFWVFVLHSPSLGSKPLLLVERVLHQYLSCRLSRLGGDKGG